MTEIELRAPAHLASRRARSYWTVRALLAWLIIGALEFWILSTDGISTEARLVVAGPTAAVALAHLIVMPQWRYRVHRWEITDTAVYTQAGWFNQERRIAPIARVQTVDTQRGPFEQIFGLANVTVTTASAKGPIKIHALDRTTADHTVAWLTDRAQASSGDAT